MRRSSIFFLLVAAAVSNAPRLAAQDAFGSWQGALTTSPQPQRAIFDITRDNGRVKVVFFPFEQSRFEGSVTADTIRIVNHAVRIVFTRIGGTYNGTLNAGGDTIAGTWTQGGRPIALVLARATPTTAWADASSHSIRQVAVDTGVSLEVLDWGGSGRPVVLLAGLGNTAHVFDQFATKLVGRYHVYGITRRGFGRSSAPMSGYSADRLADDVLAVLDSIRIAQPVLIGHSIAGQELSSIGSRHAERVAGLVYLDAGYSYAYYDSAQPNMLVNLFDVQRKLAYFSPPAYSKTSARELEAIANELVTTSLPLLERDLRRSTGQLAALPNRDVPPSAPPPQDAVTDSINAGQQKFTAIRGAVLAIFAIPWEPTPALRRDPVALAKSDSTQLARMMPQVLAFERGVPGSRVIRIPYANHYVFRSHESEVLRQVVGFIDGLR